LRYFTVTFYRKRNGKVDEQGSVCKRINRTTLTTANIIFDFKTRTIEKCYVDGAIMDKNWDRLDAYYRPHYTEIFKSLDELYGYIQPAEPNAIVAEVKEIEQEGK
jgi:hypothetical protein